MKVLLVADEFFSWGVHGGFGAFTRKLGRELVRRGVKVDAFIQKISDKQAPVGKTEVIDGVNVMTLPRSKVAKFRSEKPYKTDADIVHSQCGKLDTRLAFTANLSKKKIVTVQDLRSKEDLKSLGACERKGLFKRAWASYVDYLYKGALHDADAVCCQAELLKPKIKETYGINNVSLLPNFIDIPDETSLVKNGKPLVVWLGRLDPIKRPELCLEVAKTLPDVDFVMLGSAHDKLQDQLFRSQIAKAQMKGILLNVRLLGFQTGQTKEKVLNAAWILINTSLYECLPVSFLEACSHKCALLSTQNPDDFTVNFGYCANHDLHPLADLKTGLKQLLYADNWKHLGSKGYDHVKQHHSTEIGVRNHLDLYRRLLD